MPEWLIFIVVTICVVLIIVSLALFIGGIVTHDEMINFKLNKHKFNVPFMAGRLVTLGLIKLFSGVFHRIVIWGNKGDDNAEIRYGESTQSWILAAENRKLKEQVKKLEADLIEAMLTGQK